MPPSNEQKRLQDPHSIEGSWCEVIVMRKGWAVFYLSVIDNDPRLWNTASNVILRIMSWQNRGQPFIFSCAFWETVHENNSYLWCSRKWDGPSSCSPMWWTNETVRREQHWRRIKRREWRRRKRSGDRWRDLAVGEKWEERRWEKRSKTVGRKRCNHDAQCSANWCLQKQTHVDEEDIDWRGCVRCASSTVLEDGKN